MTNTDLAGLVGRDVSRADMKDVGRVLCLCIAVVFGPIIALDVAAFAAGWRAAPSAHHAATVVTDAGQRDGE
ncbi:hypothetical protein [Prosthecomicrobium hirschii]|uniref:Uncharacterized protein n=1 Tax=Prosthecodimorpha hirschii TaxID=665126 RepID=A0A0P6WA49_9HYPH|nr:hypothetical protein [Prosthecomicrobium hirschii]KPL55455.1 hypothetical protein ABB55_27115 [Prosthecomicrobium hirschii]MCW1839562.1 hypothetical protein [Prosthecomicrobium hirschii]TPQ51866.1 hypothetical protein C2U72_06035 [Prosthecomicrobium hirschii]